MLLPVEKNRCQALGTTAIVCKMIRKDRQMIAYLLWLIDLVTVLVSEWVSDYLNAQLND